MPDTEPVEQLGHIIRAYYGRYGAMGARLTALLMLRGFPDLEAQIRAIRSWRRQVVTEVVAHAEDKGLLCIAVHTAVALVFTMTSHATWQQLVGELDGDVAAATTVALEALCSALFHPY